jgi:hypothetical protein
MNTKSRSKSMIRTIQFFLILFAVLFLTSWSLKGLANKMQANYWEERKEKLQSRLPEGMRFEDVPLSTVLEEISEASKLDIEPWEDEGDRRVTIDVSGMTVNEALQAVVLYVEGEGAVLIKMGGFNTTYGQHWLWGYPPP